jgi:hypothetical protein
MTEQHNSGHIYLCGAANMCPFIGCAQPVFKGELLEASCIRLLLPWGWPPHCHTADWTQLLWCGSQGQQQQFGVACAGSDVKTKSGNVLWQLSSDLF